MKPFLQGKKALPIEGLKLPAHAHAPQGARPANAPASGAAASPNVEVIKEGDKIVRIVVTCVCGERVEIECLYSAGR